MQTFYLSHIKSQGVLAFSDKMCIILNMVLTKKQKQAYFENPNVCPVCGAAIFKRADEEFDSNCVWRYFGCDNTESCGITFSEEYRLTDVEVDKG
jgi:hypothetical protein